ncbi:MAG: translation initiation factor IF-6 [Candidatus Woesearchaeota archaeon]|nr:translation initiation factor IF-6 [Candidatus Woesearchaeota archaeon]
MLTKHIVVASVEGNPNIGLYGFATDTYCLLGADVPPHLVRKISAALQVPAYTIRICGTSLVGVFCAGNNNCLLVPKIAFPEEVDYLKSLGINVKVINSKLTALGNLVLCNDTGCLASTDFGADTKKEIRQALNVPLHPGTIAGLTVVGSCAVATNQGCLIHRDATEEEIKEVETLLGISCQTGTMSMASPYVRSGIIANSKGFVASDASGGPEITNADEALGYLKVNQ